MNLVPGNFSKREVTFRFLAVGVEVTQPVYSYESRDRLCDVTTFNGVLHFRTNGGKWVTTMGRVHAEIVKHYNLSV